MVLRFFAIPTETDAPRETPARDEIERRDLLGERDGVVLRGQRDASSEPQRLRDRSGGGERDVRVVGASVHFGELRLTRRRGRAAAHWNVRVLRHVKRIEAARLRLAGEIHGAHGAIGRGVKSETEFHPCRVRKRRATLARATCSITSLPR